ncbi:hypothetical protein BDV97DRAFT_233657 [Delphinella strobiligena]|nr:hypothetical protein BDV97DRAFT_233657 [Delphinella strobiligena]
MFPALQPHRPKYPPSQSSNKAPSFQQTRNISQQAPQNTSETSYSDMTKPRNQIEAMPPVTAPFMPNNPQIHKYNSATRHPVFFTPNVRKPPFPLPYFTAAACHPVAAGYVFEQPTVAPSATTANGSAKL